MPSQTFADDEYIRLNERLYHINLRGTEDHTPLLLFIHGGPGAPITPYLNYFQGPLEKHFLCVHWDQFGSGKSFGLNPHQAAISMTEAEMDLHALVTYLKERFPERPLILCGFSWGSILGLRYAARHGETLAAYIGMAQSVRPRRESRWVRQHLLKRLKQWSYWPRLVGRAWSVLKGILLRIRLFLHSPSYPLQKLAYLLAPHGKMQRYLLRFIEKEYGWPDEATYFACPLFFLTGAYDRITPWEVLEPFLPKMKAPLCRFQKIPRSGHNIMIDAPHLTALALIHILDKLHLSRRYDDIIIDFDGTLADTLHVWQNLALSDLTERGIAVPADLDQQFKSMSLQEAAAYVRTHYVPDLSVDDLIAAWQHRLAERYRHAALRIGADRFCRRAADKGYRLHCLTLTPKALIMPLLASSGIAPLFATVMSGHEEGLGKDSTALFDHLIDHAGMQRHRTLIIEDSAFALKSAKTAGLTTCAIYAPQHGNDHWLEARNAADYAVSDWQDALRLI